MRGKPKHDFARQGSSARFGSGLAIRAEADFFDVYVGRRDRRKLDAFGKARDRKDRRCDKGIHGEVADEVMNIVVKLKDFGLPTTLLY